MADWSATGARSGCDSLLRVVIQGCDNAVRGESMGCFKHQTSARHLNTKNVTSVVDGGLNQWGLFTHWPGTDLAESDSS